MKQFSTILLPLVLLAMGSSAHAESGGFSAGMWQFEISYDLIGIPQTFPAYTSDQCLSRDTPFPSISPTDSECKAQLQGHFGNTYTWTLDCSDDWEVVQGTGRIHYEGEQSYGDVYLQIINPHNPPQMMQFTFKGERKGNCH